MNGILRFGALGPLNVWDAAGPIELRPTFRRLLAALLVNRGQPVSVNVLIDRMWGESPPKTAKNTLQVHVSGLRRSLPAPLSHSGDCYRLDLDGHELDVSEFVELVDSASVALIDGRLGEAERLAVEAGALWRGEPFPELIEADSVRGERFRLTELYWSARCTLAKALVMQGRVTEAIAVLRLLVMERPFDEGSWEDLIVAYYTAGRSVEALRALREVSHVLGEEYGLELGPRLREVESRIFAQEAALMAPLATPTNLPAVDSPLVGRGEDVEGVMALLGRAHVVTIVGPPGIGKTRLAIEVGRASLAEFTGGVWIAKLTGAATAGDAVATIASAMGVSEEVKSLGDLVDRLARRPALLIIDNCEHLLNEVRAFLSERRHGSRLRVLATSRVRLAVKDEVVWPLRPIDLPSTVESLYESDAFALLANYVSSADPHIDLELLDSQDLFDVCRRTGGIPLAIELTARWVPSLDLKAIGRLALSRPPTDDAWDEEHHASVADAIAWSVALLDPEDQRAFDAAAIFASPFSREAHAAVASPGATEKQVADTLRRLVDASLLVAERGARGLRYRMLEPLQQYAEARLADEQIEVLADRHALWFVQEARRVGNAYGTPDEPTAYADVEAGIADYRAAMRHLLNSGRPEEASDVAVGLRAYWSSGLIGWEGLRWLEECLAHELGDERRLATLSAAGEVAYFADDVGATETFHRQAIDMARVMGDRNTEATGLAKIGTLYCNQGRTGDGLALLDRARELYDALGNRVRSAQCLGTMAIFPAWASDTDTARRLLTKALDALDGQDVPKVMAALHQYLSLAAWYDGDEEGARHHVRRAVEEAGRAYSKRVVAGVLSQRAMVEGRWGDHSAAAASLIEALDLIHGRRELEFAAHARGAMPLLAAEKEWSLLIRLAEHLRRVESRHGWDTHNLSAVVFAREAEAALAGSTVTVDRTPVPTAVIAQELRGTLLAIKQAVRI